MSGWLRRWWQNRSAPKPSTRLGKRANPGGKPKHKKERPDRFGDWDPRYADPSE